MQKGAIYGKCLNTFVPHCRFTCMYTYRQGRTVGFSLPRTGLGFRFFSISSRRFKLLEFLNLPKIVVEGRERKEIRICGMCEHVHNCVLFMYKLLDLMMPEKCQNCNKTNESQLKKFLCWFYSFKYFRGKLLGSSSKDFLGQRHLSTWREATKSALLSVFTLIKTVCCKIFWA